MLLLAAVLFAAGWLTRENPAEKPYLAILGGGFIFNYRVAEAFYGFTAQLQKPVKAGSTIEAEFENPAGGPPIREEARIRMPATRYSLRSPPLTGIKAGKPYRVVIRLYDYTGKKLIEEQERFYTSRLDSKFVPEQPLTVGPGYDLNPNSPIR